MTAPLERWVCWQENNSVGRMFDTLEEATNWLKDPGRRRGWFISPVYADTDE